MKELFEEVKLLESKLTNADEEIRLFERLDDRDADKLLMAGRYGLKFAMDWHLETSDLNEIALDGMVSMSGRSGGGDTPPPIGEARHIVKNIKAKFSGLKFRGEAMDEWYYLIIEIDK